MDIEPRFSRFQRLVGFDSFEKLHNAKVIVFGVGGVGGYVVESLARAGVGTIGVVDNDTVNLSNINRQIIATVNTINEYKTDAVESRIHLISPECKIIKYTMFYLPETKNRISLEEYDYIVDAIDTVTAKLTLIEEAIRLNIPIISSMGTGNRLDPSKLIFTDISKTSGDPLAKVMRRELKKRGINHLDVVTSIELPIKPISFEEGDERTPASSPFVPPSAGLLIASIVCKNIMNA